MFDGGLRMFFQVTARLAAQPVVGYDNGLSSQQYALKPAIGTNSDAGLLAEESK